LVDKDDSIAEPRQQAEQLRLRATQLAFDRVRTERRMTSVLDVLFQVYPKIFEIFRANLQQRKASEKFGSQLGRAAVLAIVERRTWARSEWRARRRPTVKKQAQI
jgi:hypothetical protein